MTTILYPVARASSGTAVHIDDWERGQEVTCFGCDQPLVGRLPHDGIKPTAHFAHKADAECSGETALHKATKAAIVHSHGRKALRFLAWECPHCKRHLHQTDLQELELHEERRPCDGVMSDVLALDAASMPRVAIEVIVTHAVEAATLERYRACGIYVVTLRPSWGVVGDIVRGVDPLRVDHLLGVVDTDSCAGCQQVLRERLAWEAWAQAQRERAWWNMWIAMWKRVGSDALAQLEDQRRAKLALVERDRARWRAWSSAWPRISEHICTTWWIVWRGMWREIGDRHARPYLWWSRWLAAWGEIGRQHVAEEARKVQRIVEEVRRRAEEEVQKRDQLRNWWSAWIRMWTGIGERASGVMAAWRPICRQCRQDLTRDHQCPRAVTS